VLFLLLSIIIDSLFDMESPHRGPIPPSPTWHARHAHACTHPHHPQRPPTAGTPCPTWRTRSTGTALPASHAPYIRKGENNVRICTEKNRNTLYCSHIRNLSHKCARIVAYFSPFNNRLYISTLHRFRPYYGNSARPIRPPGWHHTRPKKDSITRLAGLALLKVSPAAPEGRP
jgi:hypothetical protein